MVILFTQICCDYSISTRILLFFFFFSSQSNHQESNNKNKTNIQIQFVSTFQWNLNWQFDWKLKIRQGCSLETKQKADKRFLFSYRFLLRKKMKKELLNKLIFPPVTVKNRSSSNSKHFNWFLLGEFNLKRDFCAWASEEEKAKRCFLPYSCNWRKFGVNLHDSSKRERKMLYFPVSSPSPMMLDKRSTTHRNIQRV